MSQEGKFVHPVGRAILTIAALIVIVVSGNMLVASLGIGHKTLDLTEDRVHSLSDGTRKILADLGAPVEIRYYATRSSRYMPEDLKLHMRRVDDLLAEYQNLADGQLRIEKLDPQPDTDAEDSANLDGISGQTINNDNIYLGLAISCLDRTATIPFLDPNDETMLEYEISRAIAEVSATRKPVIGVISALDLAGGPPMGMGQPPTRPWVIYDELQQNYEVEDLGMEPGEIDPEKYSLLLVVHPAGITPEAEFAIDQYVLGGGTVMACLDSFSLAAQMTGGGGNPMMGQQGTPTSSTLPTLLDAWGVEMNSSQVVGDPLYQTTMQGNRPGLAILTVPQAGMPQEDSIVTRDLTSVTFLLPGGMIKKGGAGLEMETLVKASPRSGLVDSFQASRLDPSLVTSFRPDEQSHDLVLRLSGKFKTAFPDGDPAASANDESDADAESGDAEEAGETEDEFLKEGTEPGNVFLISDVDAFTTALPIRFAVSATCSSPRRSTATLRCSSTSSTPPRPRPTSSAPAAAPPPADRSPSSANSKPRPRSASAHASPSSRKRPSRPSNASTNSRPSAARATASISRRSRRRKSASCANRKSRPAAKCANSKRNCVAKKTKSPAASSPTTSPASRASSWSSACCSSSPAGPAPAPAEPRRQTLNPSRS
jgi:ABC-type uncharacterized transport system involved in gliding motility auxiliary subunit